MDNLRSVHDHPSFISLLRRLRIRPVWTPTQSSWLNLIEAQFGVLKHFTTTDDRSHVERRRRVYRYLRYRNRKVGSADHLLTRIRQIKL